MENLKYIIHPHEASIQKERNLLIQEALRQESPGYSIDKEYPIVLSSRGSQYSYCLMEKGSLTAHMNLWPRQVCDGDGQLVTRIGLIGNVATDLKYRGQGKMHDMFECIEKEALRLGLSKLLLWTDNPSIYKSRGFIAFEKEYRYVIDADVSGLDSQDIWLMQHTSMTDIHLAQMLDLRPRLAYTLVRSKNIFRELLSIPETYVFAKLDKDNQIISFIICGKAVDMQGVIHEWGGSPYDVLCCLRHAQNHLKYRALMILCPRLLSQPYHSIFKKYALHIEEHTMAYCKHISGQVALKGMFIWGLDSI